MSLPPELVEEARSLGVKFTETVTHHILSGEYAQTTARELIAAIRRRLEECGLDEDSPLVIEPDEDERGHLFASQVVCRVERELDEGRLRCLVQDERRWKEKRERLALAARRKQYEALKEEFGTADG